MDFALGSTLDDAGCSNPNATREDPPCSDRIDNDGDGKYDWDGAGITAKDPQCGGASGNKEGSCGIGFELVGLWPLLARLRRLRGRHLDETRRLAV